MSGNKQKAFVELDMFKFLRELLRHRGIVWSLVKNDIRSRYLGSALGVIWIFILPLINLLIMWFAFEQGLKAGKQNGVPFILWLITGMFPWSFFSESVSTSTGSIIEKSFLVKKVVFNVELLPFVKIFSSFILFVFLFSIMVGVFLIYGFFPNLYWLQLPYYTICLICLIMSLSWLGSAVVIFYRDLNQLIAVGLQIGFWATPIFWSPELLPAHLKFITFINPVNYVVSGYRDSFIMQQWAWEKPWVTIYFWCFVYICSTLSLVVFRRLRPHFADVL